MTVRFSFDAFHQQDTWAGDYQNPITLGKWLYANANPVMYTDPSGNMPCDNSYGGTCNSAVWPNVRPEPQPKPKPQVPASSTNQIETTTAEMGINATCTLPPALVPTPTPTKPKGLNISKQLILDQFGVQMTESNGRVWKTHNIRTAYDALSIIDKKINGKLKKILTGKNFTITDGGNQYYGWATPDGVIFHTASSDTILPLIHFLHETGHLIDYSKNNGCSNPLISAPSWVKDGYVNRELLGNKFTQPVQALPLGEAGRPAEYWADAFGNFAADNILLNDQDPTGNGQKMYDYVYETLNH